MTPNCHRCGGGLTQSDLFCPSCGAPQFRFAPPEEAEGSYSAARPAGSPARLHGICWRDALTAALMVSAPAGVLSSLSILSWGCCLWVVGAAVACIAIYHRRAPAFFLETRYGFRIGAVAGLIAAYSFVSATAVWRVVQRYVLHQGEAIDSIYVQVIQQSTALVQSNPDTQAQWRAYVHFLLSPDGRAAFTLVNSATTSLGIVFLSALGGALGVRLVAGRKSKLGEA
jgi:hypothetical protein